MVCPEWLEEILSQEHPEKWALQVNQECQAIWEIAARMAKLQWLQLARKDPKETRDQLEIMEKREIKEKMVVLDLLEIKELTACLDYKDPLVNKAARARVEITDQMERTPNIVHVPNALENKFSIPVIIIILEKMLSLFIHNKDIKLNLI